MTAGAGSRRWANDYGDIPRWYWVPRAAIERQRPRRRRGMGLASLLAMAAAVVG